MPFARTLEVNPNDSDQYVIMWDNGRIESKGTVGAALPDTSPDSQWSNGTIPLAGQDMEGNAVMRACQVIDWTSNPISGYSLDWVGHIWGWGPSATTPPFSLQPVAGTFPYTNYQDFVMNPNGSGDGYALAGNGSVPNIGGSPIIGGQLDYLGDEAGRRIYMPDFTTRKYLVFDNLGRRYSRHGAVSVTAKLPSGQTFPATQALHTGPIATACAFYNNFDTGNGDGWALASFGWIHSLNDGQLVYGEPQHEGWSYAVDLAIIDSGLGSEPLQLRVLNIYGGVEEFFVSTKPSVRVDAPSDTTNTTRPTVGWTYSDPEGDAQTEALVRVFTDGQYGSSTNEVQRITITGTPTGGTFRLGFKSEASGSIAYNASAATVDTALELMNSIGTGNLTCSGGQLPGTAVDVMFTNKLGSWNQTQMTVVEKAFTGGSSPNVTPSTVTPGSSGAFDPLVASATWEKSIVMPEGRTARTAQVEVDLVNDTYRAFMTVKDSSGLLSDTDFRQWVQNVTVPATLTMTVTAGEPLSGSLLDLTGTATVGAVYSVEFRDGIADTWKYVRGGDALIPDVNGHAQVFDREATYGVERIYRSRQFVPDPILVGAYSAEQATTTLSSEWVLIDVEAAVGLSVRVRDFKFDRKVVAGTFWPDGRREAVVIHGSRPVKGMETTLAVRTLNAADYATLEAMVTSGHVLLLRDPFSRSAYLSVSSNVAYQQLHARPTSEEDYPTRHAHEIDIPCTQVARPLVGPSSGTLALID